MWRILGWQIISCQFSPSKYSLKNCYQIFTTFFTMHFMIVSKEICHPMLTLGPISCNISLFESVSEIAAISGLHAVEIHNRNRKQIARGQRSGGLGGSELLGWVLLRCGDIGS